VRRVISSLEIVIWVVIALVGGVSTVNSQPPDRDCQYFAETGYYVCDDFLDFFETWGGLEVFGYPLTEAFNDPVLGLRVQYFQRARLEWRPHNPERYRVQLGLLGDELGYEFPSLPEDQIPAFNTSLRRYYSETGHVVSHAFLRYFDEHGGLLIFGYPRSEFMYRDGYVVQYFQRARMEWHPEDPSGPRMRLTNLGEVYIERIGIPEDREASGDSPERVGVDSLTSLEDRITELELDASVRHITTGQDGQQTVFVYVTDQRHRPVPEAMVVVTIHYDKSGEKEYTCVPTDEEGFTAREFNLLSVTPGEKVVIDVAATIGDVAGQTQTFFLPWW
jgi:hypothetical protein